MQAMWKLRSVEDGNIHLKKICMVAMKSSVMTSTRSSISMAARR